MGYEPGPGALDGTAKSLLGRALRSAASNVAIAHRDYTVAVTSITPAPTTSSEATQAIADLGSILKAAKAATSTSGGNLPWESSLLLLLSVGGAVAGVAVPGIATQVRDVLTAASGLVVAIVTSQRHVTARKG